jgi:predicted nucleotidyltransferase component of viral defense system
MRPGKGLLTPLQRTFLKRFAAVPDQEHCYLAGGTALAEYYLGHRLSFDLDLFTGEAALILPLSYQIEAMGWEGDFAISVVRRFNTYVEFLVTRNSESLKVDLAQDSPYRLKPPVLSELGVRIADLADLQVDKLLAYYGRSEPRDAVDLYFILKEAPLDDLLAAASQKDPGFDLYWFAVALHRATEFPDELERWPVRMLVPFRPRDLKAQFAELALQVMDRVRTEGFEG